MPELRQALQPCKTTTIGRAKLLKTQDFIRNCTSEHEENCVVFQFKQRQIIGAMCWHYVNYLAASFVFALGLTDL
jgi:hypothetical protein